MNPLAALTVSAPSGPAFEFLVLFAVLILGPPIVSRFKISGIIGLLLGGFLIGPHGLDFVTQGNQTVPELGQIGLLYLMFVAGAELDLGLLRIHRRSAVNFGLVTFAFPMAFGAGVGLALGWGAPAALLLGSVIASHTLVVYPQVREAGLASDPIMASAVGATVLTDTLALVVLATVSGITTGDGSAVEIAIQIVLGMSILIAYSFVVLRRLARVAFRYLGSERTVRYAIAIAAFLSAATLGATFGIEGIVGAFFAGLSLNRLVPNEGPLMNRIDFVGGAVFVPIFLVSVGLLLNPTVMVQPRTLSLALVFTVACLGGKAVAAYLTKPMLKATSAQATLVFALTIPQAAATLAATTVGFNIGLFSASVVNAVLVLILISVVVATLTVDRTKSKIPKPARTTRALGEMILVAVQDVGGAPESLRIAQQLSEPEGGAIEVLLLEDIHGANGDDNADLVTLERLCAELALDSEPARHVTTDFSQSVITHALAADASFVIAVAGDHPAQDWTRVVKGASTAPIVVVRGHSPTVEDVYVTDELGSGDAGDRARDVAHRLADALGGDTSLIQIKTLAR